MDINENGIDGKGGFYGIDVHDGHLLWYFDVETGATCRTLSGDDVRRFDGYHSESDLGLPTGFLASRPGCGFDRRGDGCGGVWSSASVDARRGLLFFASSACGESENALPYEEAIISLHFDGSPAWHWKPRPVDPDDLDFGATPNLFSIRVGHHRRDVVGVGGKDGTYYALDRTGVNGVTSIRWDSPDPSALPYWRTNVVPGGSAGGIIGTAAVDRAARRIYFSTAPGSDDDLFNPQRPTVHALDADTGAIVWQNTTEPNADASFAPTSAIPGVVFAGKDVGGALRALRRGDRGRARDLPRRSDARLGARSTSRARDRRVGLRRPRARPDRPGRDRGHAARRHHGLLRRGDARMRVGSNPRPGDGAVNVRRPATWSREESHMASQRTSTRTPPVRTWTALSVPLLILVTMGSAAAFEVVLSTQGEYTDGYLVNGKAFPPRVIVNDPDPHPADSLTVPPYLGGRHLNGKVCFFPSSQRRHRRQYIVADDEYREACLDPTPPQARCSVTNPRSRFYVGKSLDGWAVSKRTGGGRGSTSTYRESRRSIRTTTRRARRIPRDARSYRTAGYSPRTSDRRSPA